MFCRLSRMHGEICRAVLISTSDGRSTRAYTHSHSTATPAPCAHSLHLQSLPLPAYWRRTRPRCPDDNPFALGFVNPASVLRASYIIPAYARGQVRSLLPPSVCARRSDEKGLDYTYHYIVM